MVCQKSASTPADGRIEYIFNELGIRYTVEYEKKSGQNYITVSGENYNKLSRTLGYDPLTESKVPAR